MLELIDKHAVYNALKHEAETHELSFSAEAYDGAAGIIDQMPTIEAEPVRHAEWDCIDDDGGVYRCSACGETWYLEAGTPKENNMNYCPTCDAKMDGGERRCQK